MGSNVTLAIPYFGTGDTGAYRPLTCTAQLTTLATDIHVAGTGTDS
ncbi:MAG: hypothetical protein V9G13_10760 [Marmoricola sp.]